MTTQSKIMLSSNTVGGQKVWDLHLDGVLFGQESTDEQAVRGFLVDLRAQYPTARCTFWDGDAAKEYRLILPAIDPLKFVANLEQQLSGQLAEFVAENRDALVHMMRKLLIGTQQPGRLLEDQGMGTALANMGFSAEEIAILAPLITQAIQDSLAADRT